MRHAVRAVRSPVVLACLLGLAGCGAGDGASSAQPGARGIVTADEFCDRTGLSPSLRQTAVLIDQSALRDSGDRPMRDANVELFNLVLGLGDPDRSVEAGAMAPRERLSVHLAPSDGSAPRLIFTGCVPAVSRSEDQALRSAKSGVSNAAGDFMGKGARQQATQAADRFRQGLVGALAAQTAAKATRSEDIAETSIIRSLRATRSLVNTDAGIPRIFLFTNLKTFATGASSQAAAREQGFAAARRAQLSLGQAEVHVAGPTGAAAGFAKDLADAFFLGSEGELLSWGGSVFNALPAAPVRVEDYSGQVTYPDGQFPMTLRLAADAHGKLVNSWITVRTATETSTPLHGLLTCADDECQLVNDQTGFAQAWSLQPGGEPEFEETLPFGGVRNISAKFSEGRMEGEIFDPLVTTIGGLSKLRFNLSRQQ